MWADNGNRNGFFIQRNSWSPGRTLAVVHSIAGKIEGPLPGEPPYHGNPEVRVLFVRCLTSPWAGMDWKEWGGNIAVSEQSLSGPGTGGYVQIEPPWWWDWWGVGNAYCMARGARRPWKIVGGPGCSTG
jgi:hypothetical protein